MHLKISQFFSLIIGCWFLPFVWANQHACGDIRVGVTMDQSSFITDSDYQILVKNDGLPLARLNAPIVGQLIESHAVDLKGDGICEVVVISRKNSKTLPTVDVYKWQNFRLKRLIIAPLNKIARSNQIESSIITVSEKKLIFLVQDSVTSDSASDTLTERYFYSFSEADWVKE